MLSVNSEVFDCFRILSNKLPTIVCDHCVGLNNSDNSFSGRSVEMLQTTLPWLKNTNDSTDNPEKPILSSYTSDMSPRKIAKIVPYCSSEEKDLMSRSVCSCEKLFDVENADKNLTNISDLIKSGEVDINARKVTAVKLYRTVSIEGVEEGHPDNRWHSSAKLYDINRSDILKWFIDNGLDINQPVNESGQTLLNYACEQMSNIRDLECHDYIDMLLDHGARLDIADIKGNNPLHISADDSGSVVLMDKFLKKAGRCPKIIDAVNNEGLTPLAISMERSNYFGNALRLLQEGASVNKVAGDNVISPLYNLICQGRADSDGLELLIRYGADVNEVVLHPLLDYKRMGSVPAHIIVEHFVHAYSDWNWDPIMRLIKEGIPFNRIEKDGETLFSKAFSLPSVPDDSIDSSLTIIKSNTIDLASKMLCAWYKYNFPEKIDGLEGAITDQCIEKYKDDLCELLRKYPDAYNLISNTVDIIGKNLNDKNKVILDDLLKEFRNHHPQDLSMEPFIYCCHERFLCREPIRLDMDLAKSLALEDYVKYNLEPDLDKQFYSRREKETIFPVLDEYADDDSSEKPIRPSEIKITDWMIENKLELLQPLFDARPELLKAVIDNKDSFYECLTEQNRNKLRNLLEDSV